MLTLAAVTHPSTAPHASPHFPASPLNSSLVSKNPLSWSLASANDSRDKSSLILRVFSNLYCGFVNKGAFPTTFTIDLHRKYRLLKGKKKVELVLKSAEVHGKLKLQTQWCLHQRFNCTAACCLEQDGAQLWEISADLSVQLSGV